LIRDRKYFFFFFFFFVFFLVSSSCSASLFVSFFVLLHVHESLFGCSAGFVFTLSFSVEAANRHLVRVRLYNEQFFPRGTKACLKFVDELSMGPITLHQEDESDDRLYAGEVEIDASCPSTLHCVVYVVKEGKEVFDVVEKKSLKWKAQASAMDNVTKNIKRLSLKKPKEQKEEPGQEASPLFIMCEWMWNNKAPMLRICSVEPRVLPQLNACLVVYVAQVKDLESDKFRRVFFPPLLFVS
jgi:hypothetical protein